MRILFAICLVAAFALLVSCAHAPGQRADVPSRDELVGLYYMGDDMDVSEELELRSNGTYKQTVWTHLGVGRTDLHGLWQTRGKYIFFYDSDGKYNAPGAALTYAELLYYKDKPAFAPAKYLRNGRIRSWWVYQRQSVPEA